MEMQRYLEFYQKMLEPPMIPKFNKPLPFVPEMAESNGKLLIAWNENLTYVIDQRSENVLILDNWTMFIQEFPVLLSHDFQQLRKCSHLVVSAHTNLLYLVAQRSPTLKIFRLNNFEKFELVYEMEMLQVYQNDQLKY